MYRKMISLVLVAGALLFDSCLGSDSDNSTTTSNDTAITAFSLGTLNCYQKTKAKDGVTDSTYKQTVKGSTYKFYIDQVNSKIYNVDSLPYGTDASKLLATVTAKNAGTVVLERLDSDLLDYFSSSDSLDFTHPRKMRVYAHTADALYRTYEVTVNVHQEPADSLLWTLMPAGTSIPAAAADTSHCHSLYKVEGGQLLLSKDGGNTWNVEALDTEASYLPTEQACFSYKAMATSDSTDYVVLVGNSPADANHAAVWFKLEDYGRGAVNSGWSYVNISDENLYPLPKMEDLCVVRFNDKILLAIGGKGLGTAQKKPYQAIYVSHDNGITWIPNDVFKMPAGFDTTASQVRLLVDVDANLWLVSPGAGQVWRGRLSQYNKHASNGVYWNSKPTAQ